MAPGDGKDAACAATTLKKVEERLGRPYCHGLPLAGSAWLLAL